MSDTAWVTPIRAAANTVLKPIKTGVSPEGIAITPYPVAGHGDIVISPCR